MHGTNKFLVTIRFLILLVGLAVVSWSPAQADDGCEIKCEKCNCNLNTGQCSCTNCTITGCTTITP